ncbi:pyruvate kinase alpha/beta domain-containing protein [Chloroflexota bacterium]
MELKTVYFDNPGSENTDAVLSIARQRAEELGIKTILVASTRGDTGVKAVAILKGLKVIVVSHVTGFREPDTQELTGESRKIIEGKGGAVLTAAHAFAGLSRAMSNKYNMHVTGDVIADTLRTLGQGMKVACEIPLVAADSGLVSTDEDVISIAGTDRGADTAIVLKPVNTHHFFDLKVREILCKPHF